MRLIKSSSLRSSALSPIAFLINSKAFPSPCCVSCFNAKCAWSDICYEIKENAIARAEEILKHQKEIYQYCSICQETQIRKITIKDVKSDSPLLINNEAVDLAHIYYKEGDDFVNLGVASGCNRN